MSESTKVSDSDSRRDYADAEDEELVAWANEGDAEAVRLLGAIVEHAVFMNRSDHACSIVSSLSFQALHRADGPTLFSFGRAFEKANRPREALELYTMASERGDIDAPLEIGVVHERQGDLEAALWWFRLGADRGDPYAQRIAAIYLSRGKGCRPDIAEARRYASLAGAQGDEKALELLRVLNAL